MKIVKWLNEYFEEYILVILSAFTVVIIFLQVVMRYAFEASLIWSEEIARYAFIWMIYIGVSYAVKRKKHLGVDALSMIFDRKGQIIISMIANISFLIFAVSMTYFGIDIVMKVTRTSAAMQIPLSWVYAAPVAGFILTTIRLIQNLIGEIKELKSKNPPSYHNGENDYITKGQEESV